MAATAPNNFTKAEAAAPDLPTFTPNPIPGDLDGWQRSAKYAFYEAIGNPKTFVAPMVEHSDLPYRMMCRRYGAEVVFTQMLHAKSFAESAEFRRVNFVTNEQDRPLIVQFNGDDPNTLLAAARFVEGQCDAVDVNLGCPQGIAKRGHYGAFLMEELDLLTRIVSTMSNGLKIPVTCKTRIYKDFERSVRLCETLVQAGASMLTIHGRTREEKGCMVGAVDWDMIRRLKEHFKGRVPIIANGGIETWDDVQRCLDVTKCDGVMSSEAILENPTLFARPRLSVQPTQLQLAEEYLQLCAKYPEPTLRKKMRSHIMKFLHRYFCVHVDQRNAAGAANSIEEHMALINELNAIVKDHADYEKYCWYRRHRNPLPEGADVPRNDQGMEVSKRNPPRRGVPTAVWNESEEGEGNDNYPPPDDGDESNGTCGMFAGLSMFNE